jgi:hypothetical protein
MTDGYLNEYIRQRMQEKGYGSFHFEPVAVSATGNVPKQLAAYNEYYYLVTRTLPEGTVICGDQHFVVARDFVNLTFARLHEFTGNISIEATADTVIEFIRVIPQL